MWELKAKTILEIYEQTHSELWEESIVNELLMKERNLTQWDALGLDDSDDQTQNTKMHLARVIKVFYSQNHQV